jgi:hypothetical protein
MLARISSESRFRVFLLCVALLGVVFVLIATSRYGAGVSSDAARNLSTADSLLAGHGFVDMVGSPFVLWPPLYPVLLAGLALLTGLGTFHAAWYLNVLLYGINLWLAGWWLYVTFRRRLFHAVAGSLIVLFSRSLLRIHANVASEPLFETLLFVFLLSSAAHLQTGTRRSLWTMCLAAGLATLQRYLGIVLLGVAIIVMYRRAGFRALRYGALPWILASAPIVAWIVLHNYPISDSPFGPRELGAMLPIQNIGLSLTKVLWWFLPRWGPLDWLILRPWVPLGLAAVTLVLLNTRKDWVAWIGVLGSDAFWPGLLFSLVYFLLLAFTVVTADHLDLTSDRYYVVLLPIVVALGFSILDSLALPHWSVSSPRTQWAMATALVVWSIYPVYAVQSYLRQARVQGEPTNYNIANSAQFREMSVVKAAEVILARDPDAVVYSNYVNIVWFIFGHPVRPLPFEDQGLSHSERLEHLKRTIPDWPGLPGYIIWFTPNQYHHIVAPDELMSIAHLDLLFQDETGQIFAVNKSHN